MRPKKLPIYGKEFIVATVKKLDDGDSYGSSEGAARTITIKAGLSDDQYEDTLLHEVCHSILYLSGLSELLEEAMEEAIVIALENGLSQLYERKT